MGAVVRFSWIMLHTIETEHATLPFTTPLYNIQELPGYFDSISTSRPTLYHPLQLTPKNLVHHKLREMLASKYGLTVKEKNFPYLIKLKELGDEIRVGVFFTSFSAQHFNHTAHLSSVHHFGRIDSL